VFLLSHHCLVNNNNNIHNNIRLFNQYSNAYYQSIRIIFSNQTLLYSTLVINRIVTEPIVSTTYTYYSFPIQTDWINLTYVLIKSDRNRSNRLLLRIINISNHWYFPNTTSSTLNFIIKSDWINDFIFFIFVFYRLICIDEAVTIIRKPTTSVYHWNIWRLLYVIIILIVLWKSKSLLYSILYNIENLLHRSTIETIWNTLVCD
jgi:hypothetical protein